MEYVAGLSSLVKFKVQVPEEVVVSSLDSLVQVVVVEPVVISTVNVSKVVELQKEPFKIFDPNHPLADGDGYIYKAPINVEEEMVDMMDASRQYQNNIEVVTTLKALTLKTINIGK